MGKKEADAKPWLDTKTPRPLGYLSKRELLKMLGFIQRERSKAPITPELIEKYLKIIVEEEKAKKQKAIDAKTPDKPI
jgi:hypothetical protein